MSKFPNSFLKEKVLKQLRLRSNIMGRDTSGTSLSADEINNTFLQTKYFNSAWIVLISSVDDLNPSVQSFKDAGLAKNFILTGGTVSWDGNRLIKRSGINTSGTSDPLRSSAYNLTSSAGFRPMPGITDFSITSTNRWGTIRKASIKFNVWSLDDLETMDRLYFRPGYHVICEWGHTVGLGEDGRPLDPTAQVLSNYNNYFTRGYEPSEVLKSIRKSRENTFLNYDGFLGLITNFSWSFRTDLGYDCSIEVVSRGSILESLTAKSGRPSVNEITVPGEQAPEDIHKVNFLTKALKVFTRIGPQKPAENSSPETNVFIYQIALELTKKIYAKGGSDFEYSDILKELTALAKKRDELKEVTNLDGSVSVFPDDTRSFWCMNKPITFTDDDGDRDEVIVYIPFLVLFHLFNKYLEISSTSKKVPRFNIRQAGEYLTFDNHVTLDPLVAALPFAPSSFGGSKKVGKNIANGYIFNRNPPLVIKEENDQRNCFNIYVTEKTISEKIFERLNTEGAASEVNLYDLTQSILASVNTALGGINELDLDYDENNNEFVLVDRAMASVYAHKNKSQIIESPLQVAGLKSIATEFSIVTKISKNLGSMIAIASQGDDTKINLHLGEFKKWNDNLIDRFDPPPAGSSTEEVNSIRDENNPPNNVGGTTDTTEIPTSTSSTSCKNNPERPDFSRLTPDEKRIVEGLRKNGITNEYLLIATLGKIKTEAGSTNLPQAVQSTEDMGWTVQGLIRNSKGKPSVHRSKAVVRYKNSLKQKGITPPSDPTDAELKVYLEEQMKFWNSKKGDKLQYMSPNQKVFVGGTRSVNRKDEYIAEFLYGPGSVELGLGNTVKGDGAKFIGRSFIQLTGRANYDKYGKKAGVDLIKNPNLIVEDFDISMRVAAEYIKDNMAGFQPENQAQANSALTRVIGGGGANPLSTNTGHLETLNIAVDKYSLAYYSTPVHSVNNRTAYSVKGAPCL